MMLTKGTRAARYRNVVVTAAIAVIVLCGGRASAWAASKGMPSSPAAPMAAGASESPSNRVTTRSATTAPSIAETYADREANARDLENFKGGDIVIIGSGGAIVLLLVIIILLVL